MATASPSYPPTLGLRFNRRWLAGIAQDARGLRTAALEDRTRKMARLGDRLAKNARPASADPFTRSAAAWFADYDVLITPTLTRGAVPIGTWDGKGCRSPRCSAWRTGSTRRRGTSPACPAASVPFGTDDDGLPIGIQLVAATGGESTLLSLATQIEQLRPWPSLAAMPGGVRDQR